MTGSDTPIVAAESVTDLGERARGAVLVAGSHGGIIAAYLAARAGARAVILNDAGVGKDRAGIAGLDCLEAIGMAAATVSHASARIGDGADALARGTVSHANRSAQALGVAAGMRCRAAAERLAQAALPRSTPPLYAEGRFLLERMPGRPEVWGLDSIGKLDAEDAGRILVIGSHGALHGGRPESALGVNAHAALFNDAGVGIDGAGITRLPVLAARGIAAATVDCRSARIGDARSMWDTGLLSHVNRPAERLGAVPGLSVHDFVALLWRTLA
jgi:hypothetical protein